MSVLTTSSEKGGHHPERTEMTKTSDALPAVRYPPHGDACWCTSCLQTDNRSSRERIAAKQVKDVTSAAELASLLDCNCRRSTDALCKTIACAAAQHRVADRLLEFARTETESGEEKPHP